MEREASRDYRQSDSRDPGADRWAGRVGCELAFELGACKSHFGTGAQESKFGSLLRIGFQISE